MGLTLSEDFLSLSYNITAVPQQGSDGVGPAYILNGLTNLGYWYQVGLSWNWDGPTSSPGYEPGFNFIYEVFDSFGNSVYPTDGGGGLQAFSGVIHSGDSVGVNLQFLGGEVNMSAYDWSTAAFASVSYPGFGADTFVGLQTSSNFNGFFTGLMTEWYHPQPYHGNVARVTYTDKTFAKSSGVLWMDEFNANTLATVFSVSSGEVSFSGVGTVRSLSSNGASVYATSDWFATGPLLFALTVSYSVVLGGSGFGRPSITFTHNGVVESSQLTQTPTVFLADAGTEWSISGVLPGSDDSERWVASMPLSGAAAGPENISAVYTHQYFLSVVGGSGGSNGNGWYDAGASGTATSLGAFGRSFGQGDRVTSVAVDGVPSTVVPSSGTLVAGTFVMDSPHNVTFTSIAQYQLTVSGPFASSVSPPSPTGDSWFDAGTRVSVSVPVDLPQINGTRQSLSSFSVDGSPLGINRSATGSFAGGVSMTTAHTVIYRYTAQYLLSYRFTDAAGAESLFPSRVSVNATGLAQRLVGFRYWVDGGSIAQLGQAVWEGLDVSPAPSPYQVASPLNLTVALRVYAATIRVTDLLGIPVAGAQVEVNLGNGTTAALASDQGGIVRTGLIPVGRFNATASLLGISSVVAGDASRQASYAVKLPLSYAMLGVAALVTAIGAVALIIRRRQLTREAVREPRTDVLQAGL